MKHDVTLVMMMQAHSRCAHMGGLIMVWLNTWGLGEKIMEFLITSGEQA